MALRITNYVRSFFLYALALGMLASCDSSSPPPPTRPMEPWVFRSVLDKQPRMLTLALDSSMYVAYNLEHGNLYKAWKGGVLLEGAPYTSKKNVQPTSWGTAYWSDSVQRAQWLVKTDENSIPAQYVNQGYILQDHQVMLNYALVLPSGDTIRVQEQPEYVTGEAGKPGLKRTFTIDNIPAGTTLTLQSRDTTLTLSSNATTPWVTYFEAVPMPAPPTLQASFDHRGRYWMEKSDCFTCHEIDETTVGPSFRQVAQRYRHEEGAMAQLISKVQQGGSGVWGTTMMNAHPQLADDVVQTMLGYIFTLQPDEDAPYPPVEKTVVAEEAAVDKALLKPGFGLALEGVHPSYDLSTLHHQEFQPRVGGLAFLPDGRLLVTTWDTTGGVYVLDGVTTGDSSQVTVKQIASGLAEPLGIEVVDGDIFVVQKQELTQLIDHDGDEVIDEYRTICDGWGVSNDFHEFAFGLVHQDNHFYVTLSMAMRLIGDEQQQFDRGRTLKIDHSGRFERINYGLRTPNGLGLGPEGELFLTDNQGQWLPANKLIHVQPGDYHGMAWGLLDTMEQDPPMTPPTLWLPEDEIGNSPSEIVVMQDGPYQGQLLHGDVTHGGIKRDFLEKIDGEYQGAVFRFTQGLAAGVNRLRWGPDGALYVGEVGMVGGWSWREKRYGLQRLRYNGESVFEMLAVRARPKGFEIEFTEPLAEDYAESLDGLLIQQWWYEPTEAYGGPKMDMETLRATHTELSEDRTRLYLEIPNLKEEHVVYFRLPHTLQSASAQPLWSSETWYTLNNIP